MSVGAVQAGIQVAVAVESNPYAAETYAKNHRNTTVLHQDILNTIPVSWITQLSCYILLADGSRRFHSLPFRILQEHPNDELRLCFRMLQAHIEIKQVPDLPSLQKGAKFRHKQFVQVIRRDVARLPVPRRFELIWYFLEIENRQIFIQIQINLQT